MSKCIIVMILLLVTATFVLTACTPNDEPITENPVTPIPNPEEPGDNNNSGNENNDDNNDNGGENQMNRNLTIRVGDRSFAATLEDNATAHAFAAMLPKTVTMNELNGNEKYHYLSERLPTDAYRPGMIQCGDIMLYGSDCLVLFYETFTSSYSYTRIGKVNDLTKLAEAVGVGSVNVTFELSNQK